MDNALLGPETTRRAQTLTLPKLNLFATSLFFLVLMALPLLAQSATSGVPENARAKTYGEGWVCDIGYRSAGDVCAAVIVPENGYQTNQTYGRGWECLHGFRRTANESCAAIEVPDGGFLDPSGARWHCLRGYQKLDDSCQLIDLPANAYLVDASFGSKWRCERGFRASNENCVKIDVPANAYLNSLSYGRPWTCERGYLAVADKCEAVVIPEHAYFDDATFGRGWKCERGFATSGSGCEKIELPKNAHLSRSGSRWDCNKNFKESKGRCVLKN